MLRDQVMTTLREALPGLKRDYGVSELYLFGSIARGDERPDSDVDVLVEFEPGARPTLFTLGGLTGDLEDLLGRKVDLGLRRTLRPYMRDEVEREMRRVA